MTDIFLRQGEPNPSDVRLQDPSASSGASSHEIDPVGFANLSAFGSLALNGTIALDGITSAATLGAVALNATIGASGFANTQSFGSLALNGEIDLTGFANAQSFGVVALNATVAPLGIANAQSFGVVALNATIATSGVVNQQSFGSPTVIHPAGSHEIDLVGFANAQVFGQFQFPAGIRDRESYGPPLVKRIKKPEALIEPALLMPTGFKNRSAFGVPTIVTSQAATRRNVLRRNSDALLLMAA